MDSAVLRVGLISVSDRASNGTYEDKGIPTLLGWLAGALMSPWQAKSRLVADERMEVESALITLVDHMQCHLVLTTGGTGPAKRDITPDATLAVATRELPGFGERMRAISGQFVPTAILSRQTAVLREFGAHTALIINLPGQPASIVQTLSDSELNGDVRSGLFAAVPWCIELIGGPRVDTRSEVCRAYRPAGSGPNNNRNLAH